MKSFLLLAFVASAASVFAQNHHRYHVRQNASGANDGAKAELRGHLIVDGAVLVTLWQRAALPVEVGDTFAITAGCDKRWSTCREKFGNGANFRGFPHIPGNDFVLGVAKRGEPNDGGSFFS